MEDNVPPRASGSQMVRNYFSLHREVARRQMAQLDALGMQLAGNEIRAATPNHEELPSQGESASS